MPAPMIPHHLPDYEADEQIHRGASFYEEMAGRRSVRFFSDEPVPRELIELAIKTASTAPSGAHRQPWTFVLSGDPGVKRKIREAAEEEERINYEGGRLPSTGGRRWSPWGPTGTRSSSKPSPGSSSHSSSATASTTTVRSSTTST